MGVLIKRTGGVKEISNLKAHIKYIGFRSREIDDQEKGFFSNENDNANYKDFIKEIESSKSLSHSKSLKAHKVIFSLKEVDYEAYKRSGKDYKDLIRSTLKEYENKNNVKLDWIGSIHDAKGHPHAHIVIKGVSSNKDSDGRYKRIYFTKEDFKDLRGIFDKEFEKEAEYRGYEKLTSYKDLINDTINDIGKSFEAVTRDINREMEKEEYKREIDKDKEIRRKANNEKER